MLASHPSLSTDGQEGEGEGVAIAGHVVVRHCFHAADSFPQVRRVSGLKSLGAAASRYYMDLLSSFFFFFFTREIPWRVCLFSSTNCQHYECLVWGIGTVCKRVHGSRKE